MRVNHFIRCKGSRRSYPVQMLTVCRMFQVGEIIELALCKCSHPKLSNPLAIQKKDRCHCTFATFAISGKVAKITISTVVLLC